MQHQLLRETIAQFRKGDLMAAAAIADLLEDCDMLKEAEVIRPLIRDLLTHTSFSVIFLAASVIDLTLKKFKL